VVGHNPISAPKRPEIGNPGLGISQAGKHHQVDMAAYRMAPFPEFLSQGVLLSGQRLGLQVLEPLVHQVKGVVNELGRLLGRHGIACGE
jgi:hypothetical protein